MNAVKSQPKDKTLLVNRILYAAFSLLSLYFLFCGSMGDAASNLGIAMIFDPFAPAKWEERKSWQKALLLIHVSLVITLFALWFFVK